MSTTSTFLTFSGFPASEVKSASVSKGISVRDPSKWVTNARSAGPYCRRVITVVTGTTPVGRSGFPNRPLMKELFPALNCPRIATSIGGFSSRSASQMSIRRFREAIWRESQVSRTPESSSRVSKDWLFMMSAIKKPLTELF